MAQRVRVLPVGGLGHIGFNLMALEVGEDVYLIDCGIEFPDPNETGVDVVLPDLRFLETFEGRLRAILLTHGHEDHLGGVPHVLKKMNVPVYGPRMAIALLNSKLEEHGLHTQTELKVMEPGGALVVEGLRVTPLRVTHSIPDCLSLAIETPQGVVLHTGDWKYDRDPVDGENLDEAGFKAVGAKGVALLLSDSTNAHVPGWTRGEKEVREGLEECISGHPGRVIVSLFSSNLHRLHSLAAIAKATDRQLCLVGRGVNHYLRTARQVGLTPLCPEELVDARNIGHMPPAHLLICCTGTQGEPFSVMRRASLGNHPDIHLGEGDLVIHSARIIPGNERAVHTMLGDIARQGARVVHGKSAPVHASGHARQDELKEMIRWVQPRSFIPVHGEYGFLQAHAGLAQDEGVEDVHLVENGTWMELTDNGLHVSEKVDLSRFYFDGVSVGDAHELGLRERQKLSYNGVLSVQVHLMRGSSALVAQVRVESFGVASKGGLLDQQCATFVQDEIQKLPHYTPRNDAREAARMLARRFFKRRLDRRPEVLLSYEEEVA